MKTITYQYVDINDGNAINQWNWELLKIINFNLIKNDSTTSARYIL